MTASADEVETVGPDAISVGIRRSRQAKRLTLRMASTTGEVSLTVPRWTTRRNVRQFLDDHLWWIEERRRALPPRQTLGPGSVIEIDGVRRQLAPGSGRSVKVADDQLLVPHLADTPSRAASALKAWVKAQARDRAVAALDLHAGNLGRGYGRLSLRDPRTRWGSCSGEGNIMLSWRLMFAPPEVFDYVAAHEVAHLAEMNHSAAYWAVLAGLLPDYAEHKAWLRQNGATLHRIAI